MRKDWSTWSVYFNFHTTKNWAIGIDYYHEYNYIPIELLAKVLQLNFLVFNITITKWENKGWGK